MTVELTPDEDLVFVRNETRFDRCNWNEADQPEEIIEYTFEDDGEAIQGIVEASESRLLARFKSAEDAELVLAMFNILQRAVREGVTDHD